MPQNETIEFKFTIVFVRIRKVFRLKYDARVYKKLFRLSILTLTDRCVIPLAVI